MQLFLTGHSGFVGKSLVTSYKDTYSIRIWDKKTPVVLTDEDDAVIHLAGKAHDLKLVAKPDEYYYVNTELTKQVFNAFLQSNAQVFITLSSVKAVADSVKDVLGELYPPDPVTHYGKSKRLAEEYICSKEWSTDKRVYILRPCMIHGPGNKGNLNLLYRIVKKGFFWPLGSFDNKRSFLSIDNLLFVIKELLERTDIPSGIYHIADDTPLSTNELIALMASCLHKKTRILYLPKGLLRSLARMGDFLRLPLNSERLQKLTDSYVVDNQKLLQALRNPLPISAKDGLIKTIQSFENS